MAMKKQHKFFLMILALMVFMFPACELDEDDPNADLREKFVGTWRFNESEVKSDLAFYTVVISKDPGNSSQVLLRNFGNVGNFHSAYGIVTASRITVTSQSVASIVVSGTGTMTSNTRMTWTYAINDGADLINFTAVADKQ
jgi:hypothetical protein